MTTDHTPGPWEVVQHEHVDGDLWLSVNQHADAAGMKEWVAEIKYLTTDPERQKANARLIAAAPELLETLRRVIDNHCRNSDRIFCGTCSDARKLLARIDGGER